MQDYLPLVIIGLTTGAIYALAALGLVVTYTTSGVFNFAHGAVGMIGTFVFYELRESVPTLVALAATLFVIAPLMGVVIDRGLLSRLSGAPTLTYLVASLGLLVALQGLGILIFGAEAREAPKLLSRSTFQLGGVYIGYDQLTVIIVAASASLLLLALFKATHAGVTARAVVVDRDLAELIGVDVSRVTTFSWMLGCSFAALSGILLAPFVGLDVAVLTLLVVQAFGAVVFGRLTSLPWTFAGALLIGVLAALLTKFVAGTPSLRGLPSNLPFLVIFLVLVFSRRHHFTELTKQRQLAPVVATGRLRGPRVLAAGVVTLGALVLAPMGDAAARTATATIIFILIFASLSLLVGLSRQVSLCHAVFVGLGATTLSHLMSAGLPFLLALPLAGAIIVPLGLLVAVPAIRLSGLLLALATFGFGILVQGLLYTSSLGFTTSGVVSIPRPAGFDGERSYLVLAAVIVAGCVLVLETLSRTRLGRLLRALADSPTAVQSIGVNPAAARIVAFGVSTFFAAVAGGLLGALFQTATATPFDFFQSLIWVTVLAVAGATGLAGAVLAAVLFVALPAQFPAGFVVEWLPVFFGFQAMILAQAPNGIRSFLRLPSRSAGAAPDTDAGAAPGGAPVPLRTTTSPSRSRLAQARAATLEAADG